LYLRHLQGFSVSFLSLPAAAAGLTFVDLYYFGTSIRAEMCVFFPTRKCRMGCAVSETTHSCSRSPAGARLGVRLKREQELSIAIMRMQQNSERKLHKNMKNSVKSLLVAAAVTGLLGAAVVPAAAEDPKPATTQTDKDKAASKDTKSTTKKASTKDAKDKKAAASKDKNSCKGANGCSSKDEKKN
jgi:hypothetical protein